MVLSGCGVQTEGYILKIEDEILIAENITANDYEVTKNKSITTLQEEGVRLTYYKSNKTDNLKEGDKVKIWAKGKEQTSYPTRAGAKKIEVIE